VAHGKIKPHVRKKSPVEPVPAFKNLVSQEKIKLGHDMYYIHIGM
jgi:hypothetical protein